ncbi:MAG TPA: carboxypeptidase-like regulatory domain-containing protein, partial [Cyclobacteriaceae bacterium]|nr:carboxypeptidase-like regulatory domain-containing protein [Cyclobacteriaceae bacterium]
MGQSALVTGKVSDESGLGLPGVSVQIKNTNQGTTTNADGNYTLNVPADATLVFSFVGYKTAEINVSGRNAIDLVLIEDLTTLSEVVVIGYGVQKKSVATASVSKVESKDLQGFSTARVDQILQGQVAGVTFKSASGQPGSAQNIFIRG